MRKTVAMILHRMRAALVLAQQRELASRMERRTTDSGIRDGWGLYR